MTDTPFNPHLLADPQSDLDKDERNLIDIYNTLNDYHKERIKKYIRQLKEREVGI